MARRKKKPKPQRDITLLLPVVFALLILFSAFASAGISGSFYKSSMQAGKARPSGSPSVSSPLCEDFDGGNLYVNGACKDSFGYSYDYCMDSERLAEMECSPAVCKEKIYNCLDYNSSGCKWNQCVHPNCQDGDNGMVPMVKATCKDPSGIQEDYCQNSDVLIEYECLEGSIPKCKEVGYSCSFFGFDGCVNGACVTNKTGLPDIDIYGLWAGWGMGPNATQWAVKLQVDVLNNATTGYGPAETSTARFVVRPLSPGGTPRQEMLVYTPPMKLGDMVKIIRQLEVNPGKYRVEVTLDYFNEVNETNEINNYLEIEFG
jgi:hypothetical protein